MTVILAYKVDRYPTQKMYDLFAKLAGDRVLTRLDMCQAYQQVWLDEESRKLVVINTHQGLFQYKRFPFGVASATGIFHRVMVCLFNRIPGVTVYLDGILITGKSEGHHLALLE